MKLAKHFPTMRLSTERQKRMVTPDHGDVDPKKIHVLSSSLPRAEELPVSIEARGSRPSSLKLQHMYSFRLCGCIKGSLKIGMLVTAPIEFEHGIAVYVSRIV